MEGAVARIENWRTGDGLPHRGAEARIVTLEEYRADCEKLGIIEKFPEMRKTIYALKEDALTKDEVGGIIKQTVTETVQAGVVAAEAKHRSFAAVLGAVAKIATPVGVLLLGLLQLVKP